ncbi:zinc ribbon domain-containing protein [Methylobacterium tardum]|uniref:zinc ribbon domain-containing protein n=1 Tax=Methylobacterium tardum TaxID=374432 RepID=UPI0035716638
MERARCQFLLSRMSARRAPQGSARAPSTRSAFTPEESLEGHTGSTRRRCRAVLQRLSSRERRFHAAENHTISRSVIHDAITRRAGICIEDLAGIRLRTQVSRALRWDHAGWSFYQLRAFLTYKAAIAGVPLLAVDPAWTSQSCSRCGCLGDRERKVFRCNACGHRGRRRSERGRQSASDGDVRNALSRSVLSPSKRDRAGLLKAPPFREGN